MSRADILVKLYSGLLDVTVPLTNNLTALVSI